MRLWHVDVLPYLPRSQLLAQWRELNSVYAKEDQHVLINYIYEYPKDDLYVYSLRVIEQMQKRGFQIRSWDKFEAYFNVYRPLDLTVDSMHVFAKHHDDAYLNVCFFNLAEKYVRGQKDYSSEEFAALKQFWLQTVMAKHGQSEDFWLGLIEGILPVNSKA